MIRDNLNDNIKNRILDTMEEIEANTQENMISGALALKELNENVLRLSGGKIIGKLQVGDNIELETSGEGGNIRVKSPDGTWWEIDCLNNTEMRIFGDGKCKNSVIIDNAGNVRCTGNVSDGKGNTLSEIGHSIFVGFIDIGIDSTTVVQASLSLVRLTANRAIITINYEIKENMAYSETYKFIDMSKLMTALGLKTLSFSHEQTNVTLKPTYTLDGDTLHNVTSSAGYEQAGCTGIMFFQNGGFGRVYNEYGASGTWALSQQALYKVNSFGTIVIYGAYVEFV